MTAYNNQKLRTRLLPGLSAKSCIACFYLVMYKAFVLVLQLFWICGPVLPLSVLPAMLQGGPLPDAWIPELVTPPCSYSAGTLLAHLGWPGIYNNAALEPLGLNSTAMSWEAFELRFSRNGSLLMGHRRGEVCKVRFSATSTREVFFFPWAMGNREGLFIN